MTAASVAPDHHAGLVRFLSASPDSVDSAVVERISEAGERRYVAYVVPGRPVGSRELRAAIAQALQDAPVDVVLVSSLPRTTGGAVDTERLAALPVLDDATLEGVRAALGSVLDVTLAPDTSPAARSTTPKPVAGRESQPSTLDGSQAPTGGPATLVELLTSAAVRCPHGDAVRLHGRDGRVTAAGYGDLLRDAERVCGGLQAAGLRPGERVVLAAEEPAGFLPGFWGAVLAGLIIIPAAVPRTGESATAVNALRATASSVRAALVLTDLVAGPGLAMINELRAAPPGSIVDRAPDDLVLGLLTSGSTGKPKIVGQTHRAVLANAAAASAHNGFTADEVSLNWFPLDHVGGLVMFHLRDVWLGCRQVQVPTEVVLRDPLAWLELIDRYRVTVTWAPNFAYQLVTAAVRSAESPKWDLSCLTFILNGGEAVVAAQGLDFLAALAPFGLPADAIHPAWGMSETCSGVVYSAGFARARIDPSTPHVPVGRPIPGCSVRVVDAGGAVVPHGEPGALHVRGPMVTAGYLDDEVATSAALEPDGWFHTGDRAVIGSDGLTIIGRDKDVIIVGGRNITAGEVEAVVDATPGADPTWSVALALRAAGATTDQLAVVFVPVAGHSAVEVAERIRRAVLREFHVSPVQVRAVSRDDVAKTSIGKPKRALIRDRLFGPAPSASSRPSVVEVLRTPILTTPEPGASASAMLMVAEPGERTDVIAAALRDGGHAVTVTEPPGEDGGRDRRRLRVALDRAGAADHVVYLMPSRENEIADATIDRCTALATLVHTLDRHADRSRTSRLSVVTASGGDPVAQAVTAFALNAARDLPWLAVRVIGASTSAARLVTELGSAGPPEVDLGLPVRRILTTAPVSASAAGESAVRAGGQYLVTGGLGGIGGHLCHHLLREFGASLLIVGTSNLDPDEPRAARLAGLSELGEVTYLPVDVADELALVSAVRAFERDGGDPIDGVFHLAGELVRRPAADLSPADIADAIYAKGRGALAVQAVLADRPDAIEVQFTSVHSLVGAPQLAAYAAANRLQDALAQRRRELGRPSWSIAWSRWAGPGMSQHVADAHLAVAMGLATIDPPAGIAALDAVLRARPGWYVVGLDTANPRLAHLAGGLRQLERIEVRLAAHKPAPVVTDAFGVPAHVHVLTPEPAAELSGDHEVDRIMAVLGGVWGELLSVDAVSGQDDFFEMGGHSLLVPRLQERVEQRLGVALPGVAVFEHPTLRELAEAIAAGGAPAASGDERPAAPSAGDPREGLRRQASLRTPFEAS